MRGRVTEGRLNLDEVAMLFSYACMVGNDGAGSLGTLSREGTCGWYLQVAVGRLL